MDHPLDGVRAKIKRADEHIRHIHDEVMAGRAGQVHGNPVRVSHNRSTGEIRFLLHNAPDNPPREFSILAGEAIYQLRSALDHLVFELILAKTRRWPECRSQFPVVGVGSKDRPNPRDEYEAQKGGMIKGVSANAETIIDGLQPFHRGATYHEDPLWELTELNNTDKHRMLVLTVHGISMYKVTVSTGGRVFEQVFFPTGTRFEDDAEIGRLSVPAMSHDAEVSMDGDLVLAIAFDEVCGRPNVPLIPHLSYLSRYVSRVVESFAPEFS